MTVALAVDYAMENMNAEAIVITDPVTTSAEVEALQFKAKNIMAKYMRPVIFIPTCEGIKDTESWSDFTTSRNTILNGLACDQVNPVATIWEDDLASTADGSATVPSLLPTRPCA